MRRDLAAFIEHTLLRADAVQSDFARLCKEAAQHSFATVCVNSAHVALCTSLLADRQLPIAATVGFPLGASNSAAKAAEAAQSGMLAAHIHDAARSAQRHLEGA